MATKQPDGTFIIAAGEVGAFTVCPRSWKLNWVDKDGGKAAAPESLLGRKLHSDWSSLFEEVILLNRWVRYLAVLSCTAVVLFLLIHARSDQASRLFDLSTKSSVLELVLVVGASLIVIRALGRAALNKRMNTGVAHADETVSVDGSSTLPAREYVSIRQGLAGKPDAVIVEGDAVIPVERKPLAKKLRDRYVAQLLVYMRLIEEFEGARPPYGYLILGPNCRRIRVENTESKQRWLQQYIDEMRSVLQGAEARAQPHVMKCSKCDVRHRCPDRAESISKEEA